MIEVQLCWNPDPDICVKEHHHRHNHQHKFHQTKGVLRERQWAQAGRDCKHTPWKLQWLLGPGKGQLADFYAPTPVHDTPAIDESVSGKNAYIHPRKMAPVWFWAVGAVRAEGAAIAALARRPAHQLAICWPEVMPCTHSTVTISSSHREQHTPYVHVHTGMKALHGVCGTAHPRRRCSVPHQ